MLLIGAAGTWYGYHEYNRGNKDYTKARADFVTTVPQLIGEFEKDDSSAGIKYNGKALEITAPIKNIEKDEKGFYTISLGDSTGLSSVRCSMDTTHQSDLTHLQKGSTITIRGACTGFIKDEMGLGSDVILNYCVIIPKE